MDNRSENTKQLLHESLSVSIVSTLFASLPNILDQDRNAILIALGVFASTFSAALYSSFAIRKLFNKPKNLKNRSPLNTIIVHIISLFLILAPVNLAAYYNGAFYNLRIANFIIIAFLVLISIIDIIFFKSRVSHEALRDILGIPKIFRNY